MSWYFYRLVDSRGVARSGTRQFADDDRLLARDRLEDEFDGLVLLLTPMPAWAVSWGQSIMGLFALTLPEKEVAAMLRDLAVMSGAGVPIVDAVTVLAEDAGIGNKAFIKVADRILSDLRAGATLSQAFDRQPAIFSEPVRNLARIGDETGAMDRMLQEAADHLDRLVQLKQGSRQALIYPAFVFAAIFAAAAFWLYYVIPNLALLFKQFHAKLPPLTVAVIDASGWLGRNIGWVLGAAVALLVVGVVGWSASASFRTWAFRAFHALPVARTLSTASGLAFIAEYLALMLRAGIDVVHSLGVLERSTHDLYYRERLMLVRQYVERGERLSSAMRRVGGFPALVVRVIGVGEESGTLDRQLQHLAADFRRRLERVVASLAEIIKPVIVLVAGALLILFVAALVLPVYDLIGQAMTIRR